MPSSDSIFEVVPILAIVGGIVFAFVWMVRSMKRTDDDEPKAVPCVQCGYDLRATPGRCPECGMVQPERPPEADLKAQRRAYLRALREDWPTTDLLPREPAPGEVPRLLISTEDDWEAEMLVEQLRARGIACDVQMSYVKDLSGPMTGVFNFHRILVYADDLAAAQEYLWRAQGVPAERFDEHRARASEREKALTS